MKVLLRSCRRRKSIVKDFIKNTHSSRVLKKSFKVLKKNKVFDGSKLKLFDFNMKAH